MDSNNSSRLFRQWGSTEFIPGSNVWALFVRGGGGGRGVLPYRRLMGMYRWMGSHFHDAIDYNGVAFSIELLEWGHIFSDFGG